MTHMSQLSRALNAVYRMGWIMIDAPTHMPEPERAIAYLARSKDRAWLIRDSTESGLQFTIRLIGGEAIITFRLASVQPKLKEHCCRTWRIRDPFAGHLDIRGPTLEEAIAMAYSKIPPEERPTYVWWGDQQIDVPGGKAKPIC